MIENKGVESKVKIITNYKDFFLRDMLLLLGTKIIWNILQDHYSKWVYRKYT